MTAFQSFKQISIALITIVFFSGNATGQAAQAVSEIITDFNGYWRSSATAINTVKPNNSHNLLAFTYKGQTYSTGVDNNILSTKGINFKPATFLGLYVTTLPGTVTSNTKIGLGAMYDGVAVGASKPPPANNIPYYLADGINGLDLGTCVANLPVGTIVYTVNNLSPKAIGDGIPDILVSQVADPSGTNFDRYTFTNANGIQVGTPLDIVFTNISPVGQWLADFYEASANPMTLATSFTNGSRDLRLWAADFADFGITSSNISEIRNFQIKLSGVSDVAFVAHNKESFTSPNSPPVSVLPVSLTYFTGKEQNGETLLSWQTASEKNNAYFVIETSTDGKNFRSLASLPGADNSNAQVNYNYTHTTPATGSNYYRLKQVDSNGEHTYSKIIAIRNQLPIPTITLYPNPANGVVTILHGTATGQEQVRILDLTGQALMQEQIKAESQSTSLAINNIAKGYYQVVYIRANGQQITRKLLVE